jgi:glycosidase
MKLGLLCSLLFCAAMGFAQPGEKGLLVTPEWAKNATIYEVNVRQFTPEGTFAAFEKHLPRLKAMGVDILWLMPINPIGVKNRKGSLGSYYAVRDYKAVNPEFGNKDDFKHLVDAAHALGMKVIIDWVANHSSPDNVWIEEGHLDYYTLDSTGNVQPTIGTDWWDVADLNYDSKEMRKRMIDAMEYWVRDFDLDGYRCDVAGWVPLDFWIEVRTALDNIKPVFMLAEAEEVALHQAMDMTYGWEFHHIMNKIAKGVMDIDDIRLYFEKDKTYPANAYRMMFTSNHDENSWNGTEMERMGDARFALAVMAATIDGMPLIYNGQETSLDRRLKFFDKDSIGWQKMDLVDFYTKLNELHHSNQALWGGRSGGDLQILSPTGEEHMLVFVREKGKHKVLVAINLSPEKGSVTVNDERLCGKYTHQFSGKKQKVGKTLSLELKPWEYVVLTK